MHQPVNIAITGAAGQIAYSLIFRIVSGELLGKEQPIHLRLLEIPAAQAALEGVVMELDDCAYPLLAQLYYGDDMRRAFDQVDYVFLIGATPRKAGMERSELLSINAQVFHSQGKILNQYAHPQAKIIVVGNPANTNAYITRRAAPDLPDSCFSSLMRLDHNRALSIIANKISSVQNKAKAECQTNQLKQMVVWGNHSSSQYADISYLTCKDIPIGASFDLDWLDQSFVPAVQQRGAQIIQQRGHSSAASAANAILSQMYDWKHGTKANDWVSMGVISDGSYDIEAGLFYSFPVTIEKGQYHIVPDLPLSTRSHNHMQASLRELQKERDAVLKLKWA
jgi:malate dehydrogenase